MTEKQDLHCIDELISRKQAADRSIDYGTGWRLVMSDRPDLAESYRQAAVAERLAALNEEIARRCAANPKLDYPLCWKLLASEHSHFITAYNDAASLRPPQSRLSEERRCAGVVTMSSEHPLARLLMPIEQIINLKRHENPNLSYAAAWELVRRERPELIRAYNERAGLPPEESAPETLARTLAQIDKQIRDLRQGNPSLTYLAAWELAEKKFPHLFFVYRDAAKHAGKSDSDPASRTAPVEEGGPGTRGAVAMRANPLARELGAIDAEIAKKRAADPRLSYGNAWVLVSHERPELIKEYNSAAARVFRG